NWLPPSGRQPHPSGDKPTAPAKRQRNDENRTRFRASAASGSETPLHRLAGAADARGRGGKRRTGPAAARLPQHWWEWRHVIPGLAERYHVIAPDLRG